MEKPGFQKSRIPEARIPENPGFQKTEFQNPDSRKPGFHNSEFQK